MHIFFSGAQQADNTFLRRFDNYGKEKTPQHDDCGANMNLSGISRKVQILGSGSMARLCACHGAVSYTHLDVYKRQILPCMLLQKFYIGLEVLKLCLLYTSRCV